MKNRKFANLQKKIDLRVDFFDLRIFSEILSWSSSRSTKDDSTMIDSRKNHDRVCSLYANFYNINISHIFSLRIIFIVFSTFPDVRRKFLIFKILISTRYIQSQTSEIHNWAMQERWVSYFRLDPWDCMEITWNFSRTAPSVCFLSANVIKIY